MAIQDIAFSTYLLVMGIYCLIDSCRGYKKGVAIGNLSHGERALLFSSSFLIYRTSYWNNTFSFTGLIVSISLTIIAALVAALIRLKTYKFSVYNTDEYEIKKAVRRALEENNIRHDNEGIIFTIEGSRAVIKLIDYGIAIKNYRQLPSYDRFINRLKEELQSLKPKKGKKRRNIEIIISMVILLVGVGFLIWGLYEYFIL